jgi:hypothetical protein
MSKASLVAFARTGAFSCVVGLGILGCKKDEPPPPLPAPQVAEAAPAPLELKPEDAGLPPVEKATPPKSTARKSGGLQACCAALKQNAANAPEPTKGYMVYAAQACDLAAAAGKDKASAMGAITAALKSAGLPADCK